MDDIAALLLGLIGLFLAANALAYGFFRWFPSLLLPENERLQKQHLANLAGPLRTYVPEWFRIKDDEWEDFFSEYRKWWVEFVVYEDFVGFRNSPCSGKYINVSEHGFRNGAAQGEWPPRPEFYNIFFFGGSTAIHVGPDWTTIPSYLQEILNEAPGPAKPVRLYNFGRGSYFSTQERILFEQIVLDGVVPDLAIFMDGLNDFYFFEGRTAMSWFYAHKLREYHREHHEMVQNDLQLRPKWQKLGDFFDSLPITRAVTVAVRAIAQRNRTPEMAMYKETPIADEQLLPALRRYLGNLRQIEVLAKACGIDTLFVVQPVPGYRYDLSSHVALNPELGLGGHARSGQGYPLLAQHFAKQGTPANVLWLGDMQAGMKRALYVDNVHYTAEMCRMIATAIGEAIVAKGLRAPSSRATEGARRG